MIKYLPMVLEYMLPSITARSRCPCMCMHYYIQTFTLVYWYISPQWQDMQSESIMTQTVYTNKSRLCNWTTSVSSVCTLNPTATPWWCIVLHVVFCCGNPLPNVLWCYRSICTMWLPTISGLEYASGTPSFLVVQPYLWCPCAKPQWGRGSSHHFWKQPLALSCNQVRSGLSLRLAWKTSLLWLPSALRHHTRLQVGNTVKCMLMQPQY